MSKQIKSSYSQEALAQQSRNRTKQSVSNIVSNVKNKLAPAEEIDLELFGPISSEPMTVASKTTVNPSLNTNLKGLTAKAALQRLASSFVALNKRKAEKREKDRGTWKSLIQGALELQKGKIPLLLAVEAGNQSMCRELLSSQTAEQLKVSHLNFVIFLLYFLSE